MIAGQPLCRHCHQEPVTRSRGLGRKCYFTPGVREQYPLLTDSRNLGFTEINDFNGAGKMPRRPTRARPGTPEKLTVMAKRAKAGCRLFHPDDMPLNPKEDYYDSGLFFSWLQAKELESDD